MRSNGPRRARRVTEAPGPCGQKIVWFMCRIHLFVPARVRSKAARSGGPWFRVTRLVIRQQSADSLCRDSFGGRRMVADPEIGGRQTTDTVAAERSRAGFLTCAPFDPGRAIAARTTGSMAPPPGFTQRIFEDDFPGGKLNRR